MKRLRLKRQIVLVAVVAVATANVETGRLAAQSKSCTQNIIDRLETKSDAIRSWSRLQAFYHRYRPCKIDDAEVTEGVSESVARMLADHWESLATAQPIFKRDSAFEKFALAGLNITDSTGDLNRIDTLATKQCPSGLNALCQKIRQAIRDNK